MEHRTSKKVSHSGAGDDDRATYTVTCTCGVEVASTDSRTAADKYAQKHVELASQLRPEPHNYSHSVDTCKACLERSLGF